MRNPMVPAKTLGEFVALAKANPGKFNYATPGAATQTRFVTELWSARAGIKLQHIPYRGGAPAVQSVVAGQTEFTVLSPLVSLPQIAAGNLRALEDRLDAVDPSVACKAQIDQIRSAQDKKVQSKLVRFDWENCLWTAAQKQLGAYPEEAWKNFLAAKRITEVNEEESPD